MSKFNIMGDKDIKKQAEKDVNRQAHEIITDQSDLRNLQINRLNPVNPVYTASAAEIISWISEAESNQSKIFKLVKPQVMADVTGSIYSVISISTRNLGGRTTCLMDVGHSIQRTMSIRQIDQYFRDNNYLELPVAVQFGEMLAFSIEGRSVVRSNGWPDLINGMLPYRNKMCLNLGRGNFMGDFNAGTHVFQPRTL